MTHLDLSPRIDDPDRLYAALVEAHEGLDEAASLRLQARIILLLANHIGSTATVCAAIDEARRFG